MQPHKWIGVDLLRTTYSWLKFYHRRQSKLVCAFATPLVEIREEAIQVCTRKRT